MQKIPGDAASTPGACAGRLTTRLCTDKICFFAHVPDPDGTYGPELYCARRLRASKHDAGHLFLTADIARWLRQQDFAAELALTSEIDFAVTVRFPMDGWNDRGQCFVVPGIEHRQG
ncbi:hypothetical protein ABZ829_35910 [Streptomyces xanthochromogenes]|uniref:hypothetical protein n=1 Tax=Streptomyces xanthochromogenes TaxID=67384 RepID=UPI003443D2BF